MSPYPNSPHFDFGDPALDLEWETVQSSCLFTGADQGVKDSKDLFNVDNVDVGGDGSHLRNAMLLSTAICKGVLVKTGGSGVRGPGLRLWRASR